jgi:hypothetical protein
MLTAAFYRRMLTLVFVLGIAASPAAAWAQPADDSGWFEAEEAAGGSAEAPPQPAQGSELPSLPPSPLLDSRSGAASSSQAADNDPRALTDFRPELDPYGSWVQHPTYGLVWVPDAKVVGRGFAPYVSSGRWALDDGGNWIWVSDYPFGRVVFHYGRWVWASDAGWAWVPGYRYAPAWVQWRVPMGSSAYVGWAPLGPDYVWFSGVGVSFWYGSPTPWVFCPSAYVFHRNVNYYVVRDRAVVNRVATSTRRYVPASPRVAGTRALQARSPSLAAARVPAQAVPRERIRNTPLLRPSSRAALPAPRVAPGARASSRAAWSREAAPGRITPTPERLERRIAPRAEPRIAPRAEPRFAPRAEPRFTPRAEPRLAPRIAPRAEPRLSPRIAPRAEPRIVPRVTPRAERRIESRLAPQPSFLPRREPSAPGSFERFRPRVDAAPRFAPQRAMPGRLDSGAAPLRRGRP